MTTVTLSLFAGAGAQFLDNSGNVLTGGLIYTYSAGTTTPLATYTSNLGTSTHPNPIILDASGRVPGGEIWLTTGLGYKFVVKDANNVLIGTYDNIPSSAQPPILNDSSGISYEQGYTVTAGAFAIGATYQIASVGTTNFQAIGAVSNTVGVLFTATGVGSGTGTAQLSRTVQDKLQESISIMDFIPLQYQAAIRNGTSSLATYDCLPAINQAMIAATQGSGIYITNPAVYFPLGTYYVSGTIVIKNKVKLYGDNSGYGYSLNPTIKFPAGVTGIYIRPYQVVGGGTQSTGLGSIISGLELLGISSGSTDQYGSHGILVNATAYIDNCQIFNFKGNGISVIADVTSTTLYTLGNANGWSIKDCSIGGNYNGVYVTGGDSNAGIGSGVNIVGSTNIGIWDNSFLGNTWIACQVDSSPTNCYKAIGGNTRSIFLGCYAESGNGVSLVTSPSIMIGGLQGSGVNGNYMSANLGFTLSSNLTGPKFTFDGDGSGVGVQFNDTTAVYPWTFAKTTGRWGYQWAGSGTPAYISYYDRAATPANGYARDLSSASSPSGSYGALGLSSYYFGGINQMLYRGVASAIPTSGAYLQGDLLYNSAPTSGGYVGWICVASGNPGTWKTFGLIS
jgi:hypothetical protein